MGPPVASEEDIKLFDYWAIERPVRSILDALSKRAGVSADVSQALQPFRFTDIFASRDHAYDISVDPFPPPAELDFSGDDAGVGESSERSERGGRRIIPYRRFIREDAAGERSIAFVIDYMAPHKVPTDELQRSLSAKNLVTDVIKRATSTKSTTDKERAEEERTEGMVAMMLTQMFHHMIELGLEYSYVTTGKSIVFLRIKEDDPSTLYYALVAPDKGKEGEPRGEVDAKNKESDTAIAQIASFCLMALQSSTRPQAWVNAAQNSLCEWPILYPETDCQATNESSQSSQRSSSSSGSRARSGAFSETGGWTTRQCCTQACLLGLKRGGRLDEACPNVAAHRAAATAGDDQHHPIQAAELASLLREQLSQDMEQNIQPLEPRGKHGARGTLFKLTLARYGYTFVGKGTVIDNVRYFLHEAKVYSRLERLQGDVIPVHLGNIDLAVPYRMMAWNSYYFTGAQIVHMLLMSWAGEEAAAQKMSEPDLEAEATRLSGVLQTEGVYHGDEREANILWSGELHRVMFVDFDRAVLLPPPKPKLIKSPSRTKKRKRKRSPGPPPRGLRHSIGP